MSDLCVISARVQHLDSVCDPTFLNVRSRHSWTWMILKLPSSLKCTIESRFQLLVLRLSDSRLGSDSFILWTIFRLNISETKHFSLVFPHWADHGCGNSYVTETQHLGGPGPCPERTNQIPWSKKKRKKQQVIVNWLGTEWWVPLERTQRPSAHWPAPVMKQWLSNDSAFYYCMKQDVFSVILLKLKLN